MNICRYICVYTHAAKADSTISSTLISVTLKLARFF